MRTNKSSINEIMTAKTLYIDPISGISGDMFLSACVDLGVDRNVLITKLKSLPIDPFDITFNTVSKKGIRALSTQISFSETNSCTSSKVHQHRHLRHIEEIINNCNLSDSVKKNALDIFSLIANAEAKIHNTTVDKVHFHEVGAMDSIIDIIGAAICLEELDVDQILCGHVPTGYGTVFCAHGVFPIPAPATLEILKGVPIKNLLVESELTTPTGAAIVKAFVTDFSACLPSIKVTAIGYGAGNHDFEHPNVLRLVLGERILDTPYSAFPNAFDCMTDKSLMWILEASIDDMQPEFYQYIVDRILQAGANDVMIIPAIMKKDRAGSVLHVLAEEANISLLKELIFKETTTLGIRSWSVMRDALGRSYRTVIVRGHEISIKLGLYNNTIINAAPEYEDCKRVAIATNAPINIIYQEAIAKWSAVEE